MFRPGKTKSALDGEKINEMAKKWTLMPFFLFNIIYVNKKVVEVSVKRVTNTLTFFSMTITVFIIFSKKIQLRRKHHVEFQLDIPTQHEGILVLLKGT
mgnify:CR=1 FL=1